MTVPNTFIRTKFIYLKKKKKKKGLEQNLMGVGGLGGVEDKRSNSDEDISDKQDDDLVLDIRN